MDDGKESMMETEESNSPVEVKKEPVESEDIKDYAANTMNELLAIYGYDEKVDKSVTEELHLQNFSDSKQGKKRKDGKRKSLRLKEESSSPEECASTSSSSTGSANSGNAEGHMSDVELARGQLCSAIKAATDLDQSKSSFEQQIICAWCQQLGVKRYTLNTATESKAFCSEKCFAACRRAYFKRNKVCDWCRHIRHTKEYIEFQNGDAKLQFCSIKCLNQYKMDVFCKETQSLGSNREYKINPLHQKDGGSTPPATGIEPVSLITTTNKKAKKLGARSNSEARSKSDGACSPLALTMTAGASNGTVRQIQNMLQNRGSIRVQAQADSTVSNGNGAAVQNSAVAMTAAAPPQAAVNAAASVQAAAALQQHQQQGTFLGVPAVVQAPLGAATQGPVLGQTPLVVSGNQIPFLQQQSSNVILQPPQIGAPPTQILSPTMPTSPAAPTIQRVCSPVPSSSRSSSSSTKPASQSANPSSVVPPVTIIVPHPIFVPIPIPVPVPIPIRAEVYDTIKNEAGTESSPASSETAQKSTDKFNDERGEASMRSSVYDFDMGRSKSLMNLSSLDAQSQGIIHDRVRILKGLRKQSSSQKSTPNLLLGSFPASNGLHRSASLDLSLASQSRKSSLHSSGRKVKTQLVLVGEEPGTSHDVRESSRKVREVLRCHLNKRLSQSALNLAELGLGSTNGSPLRRSHSLSRLPEPGSNPGHSLGAHRPVSALSLSPRDKGSTPKKPRRVLDNCNRIEEDAEMERKLMIHEDESLNSGTEDAGIEDDQDEPSCKRKKWTNDHEDV